MRKAPRRCHRFNRTTERGPRRATFRSRGPNPIPRVARVKSFGAVGHPTTSLDGVLARGTLRSVLAIDCRRRPSGLCFSDRSPKLLDVVRGCPKSEAARAAWMRAVPRGCSRSLIADATSCVSRSQGWYGRYRVYPICPMGLCHHEFCRIHENHGCSGQSLGRRGNGGFLRLLAEFGG